MPRTRVVGSRDPYEYWGRGHSFGKTYLICIIAQVLEHYSDTPYWHFVSEWGRVNNSWKWKPVIKSPAHNPLLNRVMGLVGGVAPWGRATLVGSGKWDWFMGAWDTGWIGVMGLIHRGAPWGHATLAGSGRWVWLMGAHNTGWTGAMGLIYGGAQHWLERGDGIDLWGCVKGLRDWIGEMGLNCGGTPWGCDTGCMRAVGLSYGGVPCGRATGLGWWNWFVGKSHGGTRHWLDPDDGIDLCGCVMGSRDTGWIWAMGLTHGDVPNDKVIWLLNLIESIKTTSIGKC